MDDLRLEDWQRSRNDQKSTSSDRIEDRSQWWIRSLRDRRPIRQPIVRNQESRWQSLCYFICSLLLTDNDGPSLQVASIEKKSKHLHDTYGLTVYGDRDQALMVLFTIIVDEIREHSLL